MNSRHTRIERKLRSKGFRSIAGIDEAGRGPLAGPVVAAAVIMPRDLVLRGVDDSKVLAEAQREEMYAHIRETALSVGVGVVHSATIDRINILQASFKAMCEAILQLDPRPDHLLVDGNRFQPDFEPAVASIPYSLVVDGDAKSFSIAAASIIAKVTRDRFMIRMEEQFPGYGFAKHKGYSTPEHREAIFRLGYCELHRRSFTVREQLEIPFEKESVPV